MYKSKFNSNNKGKNDYNNKGKYNKKRFNAYQSNSNSSNYRRLMSNDSSSSFNSKSSTSSTVPVLNYSTNAENNLAKWIQKITPVLVIMFGRLASFINTDVYFVPTPPEPPDTPLTDATDPGRVNRMILQAKTTEYAKSIEKLQEDKSKMWGEIEKYLSDESIAQLKLDAQYKTLLGTYDVLGYWRLIKQVHRTQAGKINTVNAALQALTNYYAIKQKPTETLVEYKDRITAAVERIRTADNTAVPTDLHQARKFTTSLDPRRFNRFIMDWRSMKRNMKQISQQLCNKQVRRKS